MKNGRNTTRKMVHRQDTVYARPNKDMEDENIVLLTFLDEVHESQTCNYIRPD